jgi:hypothetical protein
MQYLKQGAAWGLYHNLWTIAVGQKGYDKKKWMLLGELLFSANSYKALDAVREYIKEERYRENARKEQGQLRNSGKEAPIQSSQDNLAGRPGMAVPGPVQSPIMVDRIPWDPTPCPFCGVDSEKIPREGAGDNVRTGHVPRGETEIRPVMEQRKAELMKIYSSYRNNFPGESIPAAILALAHVVQEGLEKLDKPRYLVSKNPIGIMDLKNFQYEHVMDPTNFQNTGKP